MDFEAQKVSMADSLFQIFGQDVTHTSVINNSTIKTKAIIKRNFESNPGAFLTGISEKITVIDFKYSELCDPRPGDTVSTYNESFIIDNELENDNIRVRVSVKKA